ncbi:MAG: DUF1810 domain-containing protein [archaeon]|nr:DUF1810 domain-containing protein [archaeon]
MPNLDRFVRAQKCYYNTALEEVRNGRKESHWIWYIFPQLKDLGFSDNAKLYGIDGLSEAKEYIADPFLKERLIGISQALLESDESDISAIFGYPDDLKVQSCMTLFRAACPEEKVFDQVLERFFNGEADARTLEIIGQ